jgi:hypothetical protein
MTSPKAKFEQDLSLLLSRLVVDMGEDQAQRLFRLRDDLLNLQRANVVKINHSVMELVCAKYLVWKGYDVQLEYKLDEVLTCDLYSTKGYGNLIVEIETGYIPPEHALDPLTYTYARLASKIVRYSSFAGKFAIGVPPHYILPLPRALSIPPRKRTLTDVEQIKNLCDHFYQNPPVTLDGIQNARIHEIYIIDVDRIKVHAMDPEAYVKRALQKGTIFSLEDKEEDAKKEMEKEETLDFYLNP